MIKNIKVGLLVDEFFGASGTAFGGYGFLARNYVTKYIPNENIQIDVLLEIKEDLKEVETTKVDNILLYRLPKNIELCKKWLSQQNYDIFISIEITYKSYEILNIIKSKPLIFWIQDPRPKSLYEIKRKSVNIAQDPLAIDKNAIALINYLTQQKKIKFISQGYSINDYAKELYYLPNNIKIKYMPNPIKIDYKYKFDISLKKKQCVFLGRLEAQKRVWIYCEIAKNMPQYDFYVIGKFFRDEDINKKILEKYINGNINNLHFLGHLEGEDKEKLLKESRLLINCSIWEGIPLSWLESLQYGTLIVSCLNNENLPERFGQYIGEILGDGYDKVYKFIPAIEKFMLNDDLYSKKAYSSIEYIRSNHSLNKFIPEMRKLLIKEAKKYRFKNVIKKLYNRQDIYRPYKNYIYININSQNKILSEKTLINLPNFIKMLNGRINDITFDGIEAFNNYYIQTLIKKLSYSLNTINIITYYSIDIEKLKEIILSAGENLGYLSISADLCKIKNIKDILNKIKKIIDLQNEYYLDFFAILKLKNAHTENDLLELMNLEKEINMKVEIENNSNNFKENCYSFGNLCYAGCNFFYIDCEGNINRCYTKQINKKYYNLGNLEQHNKIKIFKKAIPCLSAENGTCNGYLSFIEKNILTNKTIEKSKLKRYMESK